LQNGKTNVILSYVHASFTISVMPLNNPLVEQELLTLQEHLSSSLLFCEVCVAQCLDYFPFYFGHCIVSVDLWLLITLFGIFKLFSVIYNKYSILMTKEVVLSWL
jgi:hypothetical protein